MNASLSALPAEPLIPVGVSWPEWLAGQLVGGWRPGEWDSATGLFTGDVVNPMTGAYPCATPSCPTVIQTQHSRCAACRRAKARMTASDASFDASYVPQFRQPGGKLAIHQFTLARHTPLVGSEVLYGLQQRDLAEVCLPPWTVRTLLAKIPSGLPSLLDLDRQQTAERLGASQRGLLRWLLAPLDRLNTAFTGTDPTDADVWDCALVGLRSARDRKYPAVFGTLDFSTIGLVWLREVVKTWARDLRPPVTDVGRTISVARLASRALSARPHAGDPTRLRLADMGVVIEAVMASTDPRGKAHSHSHRRDELDWWRRLLDYARPAGLMTQVPDGFTLSGHYRVLPVDLQHDEEPGEAIGDHVLAQMDQHLDLLGAGSAFRNCGWEPADYAAMYQTAYQIQRDTGRRNNEVVSLSADCLQWDGEQPVLIYDNHKARRMGRRLPIHHDTANVIQHWQQRRSTLPLPQESACYLFPAPGARNRPSRKHLSKLTYAKKFRDWLAAMPPLVDVGLDEAGDARIVDKATIKPYGLRHAYAQRHADGGTDVDVLRELMDHRSLETTAGYYQVSFKRKQEAIRLLAPTAIDRHGRSAGFADETVYELSSVAVPFGNCTEPSNVKAGGKHCPIRFQCAGCSYYRPDPSFLPAIAEHITELRADRELATATDAAAWVIGNIDDQLAAFTTVHDRLTTDLQAMPDDTRQAVEDAGRELRKARAAVFIPVDQLNRR
ncbi:MAG: tyrosine-type recombinase/integrase [Nakamurella sp.]